MACCTIPATAQKFADNLKRELPRIPFAPDFRAFAKAGEKLAKLHLDYEKLKPWDLDFIETPRRAAQLPRRRQDAALQGQAPPHREPLADARRHPARSVRLPPRQPLAPWNGSSTSTRSRTDKRSGITSDPNRDDDPEYIVRLVGQVIRVSVETVRIVNSLPTDFGAPS